MKPETSTNTADANRVGSTGGSALPLRDALAVSFFSSINSEGAGTIALAAKELGIEVKEYDCDKHWPILVARRCYAQADAFLAVRSLPNGRDEARRTEHQ